MDASHRPRPRLYHPGRPSLHVRPSFAAPPDRPHTPARQRYFYLAARVRQQNDERDLLNSCDPNRYPSGEPLGSSCVETRARWLQSVAWRAFDLHWEYLQIQVRPALLCPYVPPSLGPPVVVLLDSRPAGHGPLLLRHCLGRALARADEDQHGASRKGGLCARTPRGLRGHLLCVTDQRQWAPRAGRRDPCAR